MRRRKKRKKKAMGGDQEDLVPPDDEENQRNKSRSTTPLPLERECATDEQSIVPPLDAPLTPSCCHCLSFHRP